MQSPAHTLKSYPIAERSPDRCAPGDPNKWNDIRIIFPPRGRVRLCSFRHDFLLTRWRNIRPARAQQQAMNPESPDRYGISDGRQARYLIEAQQLSKVFSDKERGEVRGVDSVSFRCAPAEIYGLLSQ